MESRDSILKRVLQNQPLSPKEAYTFRAKAPHFSDVTEKFKEILTAIGGSVFEIKGPEEINTCVAAFFPDKKNEVIYLPEFNLYKYDSNGHGKDFENVDLAVLKGEFAVAENGAVWMTEKNMPDRCLPFICEHLILVINRTQIVATLHEAYQKIKATEYQYGTFLAGPSKTADIEQSLVLGAHGAKTTGVWLVGGK